VKENSTLRKIRDRFVASGVPNMIKGILRIHLEFPRVSNMNPTTYVKKDADTGTEDVMVYITMSNIDDFFYDGIAQDGDMLYLRGIIKYVAAKVSRCIFHLMSQYHCQQ
jgi:hypothetical protein